MAEHARTPDARPPHRDRQLDSPRHARRHRTDRSGNPPGRLGRRPAFPVLSRRAWLDAFRQLLFDHPRYPRRPANYRASGQPVERRSAHSAEPVTLYRPSQRRTSDRGSRARSSQRTPPVCASARSGPGRLRESLPTSLHSAASAYLLQPQGRGEPTVWVPEWTETGRYPEAISIEVVPKEGQTRLRPVAITAPVLAKPPRPGASRRRRG